MPHRLVAPLLLVIVAGLSFSVPFMAHAPVTSFEGGPPTTPPVHTASFHRILQGGYSHFLQPVNLVINDQETLASVWAQAFTFCVQLPDGGPSPCYPLPKVDFESRTVLAVFLGERGNGGFSIEIVPVENTRSDLLVHVRVIEPGPYCAVTMALTQPFDIVDVPKTEARIAFSVENSVRDCSQF